MTAPLSPSQQREIALLLRRKLAQEARDDLLRFAKFMRPDPNEPDNPEKSQYRDKKYHRIIAAALEQVEVGIYPRLNIDVPPRHGKTELGTKTFVPWYIGRNPHKSVVVATYNDKFAGDLGRAVRAILKDPLFQQVFPGVRIKKGAAAVDRIEMEAGGIIYFAGRGSTITGRGGDLLLIDDPIKDRKEADSPTIREQLWTWYTQTMSSRMMTDSASVILIQTRWHDDDLPGRILDPTNTLYNEAEAKYWHRIHLMALAGDDDILGRNPGQSLWPERFSPTWLESRRRIDPRGFEALYQGRPSPEDGAFFRADDIKEYHSENARPPLHELRIYAASDHAVSLEQDRDLTCLMIIGIDKTDNIWVFPDLFWKRALTDVVVDNMVGRIRDYKPLFWWAERGHISKSIGPFLRKRMTEVGHYAAIDEIVPIGDKQARAQSIAGRVAMGKVFFPAFTEWWPRARSEMLKFPLGAHDDFVDTLSLVGLGLTKQVRGEAPKVEDAPKEGTFAAMLAETKRQTLLEKALKDRQGW